MEERFWKKVNKKGGNSCWEWKAGRFTTGYGQFWKNNKLARAHRVAWELTKGEIPENQCVLHKCDNPPCVNPIHLWLGTMKENTLDMISKNRQRYVGPWPVLRGEDRPNSKLKEYQVKKIREMYNKDRWTHATLGAKFGVKGGIIGDILSRRKWAHI